MKCSGTSGTRKEESARLGSWLVVSGGKREECVTKLTATLPVDRSSAGIIQPRGLAKAEF